VQSGAEECRFRVEGAANGDLQLPFEQALQIFNALAAAKCVPLELFAGKKQFKVLRKCRL